MSTKSGDSEHVKQRTIPNKVAKGVDRWLVRLIPISVIGLLLLIFSEVARANNEFLIPIAMISAAIWALSDLR